MHAMCIPVALRKIDALAAIVARVAGALVHVSLAARARESSWAEALWTVVDGHAKTSMLTNAYADDDRCSFIPSRHDLMLILSTMPGDLASAFIPSGHSTSWHSSLLAVPTPRVSSVL